MYEHPAFCHNVLRTKNVLRAEEFPYGSNFNPRSQLTKIFQISIKKYSIRSIAVSIPLLMKNSFWATQSMSTSAERAVIALMIQVDWISKICYKVNTKDLKKKKKSLVRQHFLFCHYFGTTLPYKKKKNQMHKTKTNNIFHRFLGKCLIKASIILHCAK